MSNVNKAKAEWNAVIEEKLKDGLTVEDLHHEYAEGISLEPNVMAADLAGYDHALEVDRHWSNMAVIDGANGEDKNALALQALQQGANGLSIKMSKTDSIATILKDVLVSYLDVRIDCSELSIEEIAAQKSTLTGEEFSDLRWIGGPGEVRQLTVGKEDRIQSIKACLSEVDAAKEMEVVVNIGKNLLFEIASLRALRSLLDEKGGSFRIIVEYDVEGSNELGDYNLIEKTYKVLSGIMGCADAILTSYAGDEESRLTLNIHNVLDLESGMKNVLDPLSGSYYIEKLTGEIIRQVKSM